MLYVGRDQLQMKTAYYTSHKYIDYLHPLKLSFINFFFHNAMLVIKTKLCSYLSSFIFSLELSVGDIESDSTASKYERGSATFKSKSSLFTGLFSDEIH